MLSGGVELGLCNLNGLASREAVFAAIRDYVAAHPGEGWIDGGGWDLPLFPGANPSRRDLDRLVGDPSSRCTGTPAPRPTATMPPVPRRWRA